MTDYMLSAYKIQKTEKIDYIMIRGMNQLSEKIESLLQEGYVTIEIKKVFYMD